MKRIITLLLLTASFFSFGQSKHKMDKLAIQKIEAFKVKSKFELDTNVNTYYTGLSNTKLKSTLTGLINQSADDFISTVKNQPSDQKFQADIKKGLARINLYYIDLDTEDREKVCSYYVELMDCVGLKNSNGEINKWLYGFDVIKK